MVYKELTTAERLAYAQGTDVGLCPYCGSVNIACEEGILPESLAYAREAMWCSDCLRAWECVYKLLSIDAIAQRCAECDRLFRGGEPVMIRNDKNNTRRELVHASCRYGQQAMHRIVVGKEDS